MSGRRKIIDDVTAREILFRGKRLNGEGWTYGSLIKFSEQDVIFAAGGDYRGAYDVYPSTVGQYTGLTDKNGVKVFEGDILKTDTGGCFAVEWDKNNGRFLGFTPGRERRIVYVGREPRAEIIGNIHDSPELLKEEQHG